MNKEIKRFSDCSDPDGYKKFDREWIDLYKKLYSTYSRDELITAEKDIFNMANNIKGFINKIDFLIMLYENNIASLTAVSELIDEKAKGGDV